MQNKLFKTKNLHHFIAASEINISYLAFCKCTHHLLHCRFKSLTPDLQSINKSMTVPYSTINNVVACIS